MRIALLPLLGLAFLASTGYSHMYESFPYPRGSPDNPKLPKSESDNDIHGPTQKVCRGHPAAAITHDLVAGKPLNVKIRGSPATENRTLWATHKGGHCQWGISYDNAKTVAVFYRHDNTCVVKDDGKFDTAKVDWTVPIPKDLVNTKRAVFVWTWIPAQGGADEIFQSCVDVSISGGKPSGTFSADSLVYRNFPGWPILGEEGRYSNGKDPNFANFLKDIRPVTVGPNQPSDPPKPNKSGRSPSKGYVDSLKGSGKGSPKVSNGKGSQDNDDSYPSSSKGSGKASSKTTDGKGSESTDKSLPSSSEAESSEEGSNQDDSDDSSISPTTPNSSTGDVGDAGTEEGKKKKKKGKNSKKECAVTY
ncbi:hypothetical protein BJ684DRAFT_18327 [Piptocephalis cylindrospora]|uniref:Chitin-binding type-4 domain-containing protein n=1 Tax=Piptocephalis cylindrospora TaxID=1907219 RepID=A0A4P9Y846_9FUNG|nr:hypothetical protein BJ684DRAFT_18327 [Piptocephalis cylindrospora]|eukprot:RKP15336.1 hypothetical protein BJ684DRAFT_18327 [Piptocephalis cylindrospora]